MSILEIQRGGFAEALSRMLRLQGKVGLQLDSVVIPTIDLNHVGELPYSPIGIPFNGWRAIAAIAAENGYIWISPGLDTTLDVRKVKVENLSAAPITIYDLILITQPDQASIFVSSFSQMTRTRQSIPRGSNTEWPEQSGAVIDQGGLASVVGTRLDRVRLGPAPSSYTWDLASVAPDLTGMRQSESGIQAIGVVCETVNQGFEATFWGREYPSLTLAG